MKLLVLFFLALNILNADVYKDVATNFLKYKDVDKEVTSTQILKKDDVDLAYLYTLSDNGYILVPVMQNASPVKSYSFLSNYENLPKPYKEFLINELYALHSDRTLSRTIDSNNSDRWDFLQNFVQTSNTRTLHAYTPNTYLLTTTWNQTYPYNKFLPKIDGVSTLAGCVQVAMGQVMRYHSYPQRGNGVVYGAGLKANLNRYYNWDILPNNDLDGLEYQNDELGYLIRDLAVVNDATLGTDVTTASVNINALIQNFGYSNTISEANISTSKDNFINTVKSQIDAELPVLLSIPGHMVVIDGYKDDSSGEYLHLNMGWGGANDTFYNIDDHIVAAGLDFGNTDLDIIYNIKPCSDANHDCSINLENSDTIDGLNISGTFDYLHDADKHQLYLNGTTTFSGDRGYSNQAFYISVYDSNNELVLETDEKGFSTTLDAGLYTVSSSICNFNGGCYTLENGFENYTTTITTSELTQTQKDNILTSLQTPPVIDQELKDMVISSDTKVLINGYDDNSEDNVTFEAFSSQNLELTFEKNILTIHPLVALGYETIDVKVSSNSDMVQKSFKVLINDGDVKFGKEFSVNGTFADASELDKYKVVLDGECSISGFRGYSNQAFYTSLMDEAENKIVDDINDTFTTTSLTQDFYLIGASLTGQTGYYPYDENLSNYTLSISCPDANESVDSLISLLNITLDDTQEVVSEDINKTKVFEDGWSLVGADEILSIDDIECVNSNLESIWKYKNNSWKVFVPNNTIAELETFSTIEVGEGFWVNCH